MTQPDAPPVERLTARQMIERALAAEGVDLAEFVAEMRPDTAWRLIAIAITKRTGVDITAEAVRLWFG